ASHIGGEILKVGDILVVTGTKSTSVTKIRVEFGNDLDAYPNPTWQTLIDNYNVGAGTTWSFDSSSVGWSIPDKISPNTTTPLAKIRITDKTDWPAVALESSADNIKVIGKFNVTNPTVGLNWVVGETRPITWSTIGTISTVNVQYSKDGITWTNFPGAGNILNNPNDVTGKNVTIQDAISNTFRVRVQSVNDPTVYKESALLNVRGKLELLSPVGTDRWQVSDSDKQIIWLITGSIPNVKIAYDINGGGDGYPNTIIASTAATDTLITPPYVYEGRYTWPNIPNIIGNAVTVRVSTIDGDWQNLAIDSANFKVRGKLEVVAPNSGETYWVYNNPRQTTLYPIQWRITGTVTSVKIGVSVTGTYNTILITPTGGAGLYTYNWPVSDTVTTSGFIKIWDNDYPGDTPEPVNDVSNAAFNIKSKLELTAPITTTVWEVGQAGQFTWESAGSIGNVVLEYRNGSGSWVE
ncbi:MAG: hypothetical protein AB1599_10970, partial [Planctomycetota bacterium]